MRIPTVLTLLLIFISYACSAEKAIDNSFSVFWPEFRQAVISSDKNKIASLTHFPFEVLGVDDSYSARSFDRTGFLDIYERLVTQTIYFPQGNQIISKSMREMIYEAKNIPKKNINAGNTMQFEQFEFERIDGQWRFVRAYLE